MKAKAVVKKMGRVVVHRTLHVPPGMRGKGLSRFVESKPFKKEVREGKRLLAQNTSEAQFLILTKDSTSGSSPDTKKMAQATRTQKQSAAKATPAPAAKKGAAKKAAAAPAPVKGAAKKAAAKTEEKGPGKIEQIIALHKKGKSNQEIVEAGFNKTTVSIQVAKYKKENAKPSKAKK